ncbi:hypothetical protein BB560_005399 [Smittium megazygosporum]|uniref:Uncharacterized protein n=1 Tax=Smittium megazygosporum TaxID=133381 RepID=A0A2T9Z6B2_9FUNG|nr:hypothetical protein BB560_005399 [Smittium megazygosporum]
MSLENAFNKFQKRQNTLSSQKSEPQKPTAQSVEFDIDLGLEDIPDFNLSDIPTAKHIPVAKSTSEQSKSSNTENLLDFDLDFEEFDSISFQADSHQKESNTVSESLKLLESPINTSIETDTHPPISPHRPPLKRKLIFNQEAINELAVQNSKNQLDGLLGLDFDDDFLVDEIESSLKEKNTQSPVPSQYMLTPSKPPSSSRANNPKTNTTDYNHNKYPNQNVSINNTNTINRSDSNVFVTPANRPSRINLNKNQSILPPNGSLKIDRQASVTKKVSSINRTVSFSERSIPGPAGITGNALGTSSYRDDDPSDSSHCELLKNPWKTTSGTFGDQDFDTATWAELLKECKISEYKPSSIHQLDNTNTFTSWSIKKIHETRQPMFVPYLLVLVSEYSPSDQDSSATLIDPTGQ